MSQACCPLVRLAKSGVFTALFLAGVVALSLSVLAPWRSVDAAAPAAGDDPLNTLNVVRPVPSALEQRGLKQADTADSAILSNWNYTDGSNGV
jgi:hypothetical protein